MATVTHPHRGPTPHTDSWPTRVKESLRRHRVAAIASVGALAAVAGLALVPKGQTSAERTEGTVPAAGAPANQNGNGNTTGGEAVPAEAVTLPPQPEHPAGYFPSYEVGANAPTSSDPQEYLNQFYYQIEAAMNTNDEQFLRVAGMDRSSEMGDAVMQYAAYNATQRETAGSQGFDTLIPVFTGQGPDAPGDVSVYRFDLWHMYQDTGDAPWRAVFGEDGTGYTGQYELHVDADGHTLESRFVGQLEDPFAVG